ncbi:unnamed protein product [Boreogadus saida]
MLGLLDGASGGPAWLSGVPSCTASLGRRRAEPLPGSPVILSIKTGDCLFTKSAPLGIAAVQSGHVSDAFMNTFHVEETAQAYDKQKKNEAEQDEVWGLCELCPMQQVSQAQRGAGTGSTVLCSETPCSYLYLQTPF